MYRNSLVAEEGEVIEGEPLNNVIVLGKVTCEVRHVYEEKPHFCGTKNWRNLYQLCANSLASDCGNALSVRALGFHYPHSDFSTICRMKFPSSKMNEPTLACQS